MNDPATPGHEAPTTTSTSPSPSGSKNPGLAAVLSLFPGLGNVYNGLYLRAVTFFLIIISLIALTDRGYDLMGFAVAFFWLFNVLDAYRQATLINYGFAQDLGLADLPARPRATQGGVAAGAILIAIGLFAFVDQYLHIDLDWLLDLWPLGLVLVGAWMVWASLRERRRHGEPRPEPTVP